MQEMRKKGCSCRAWNVHVSFKSKIILTLNLALVIPRIDFKQTRWINLSILNARVAKKWHRILLIKCASKQIFKYLIKQFLGHVIL
jgi:hypothetical protein